MSEARTEFRAAYALALASFHADPRSAAILATIPASAWNRGGCMAFATAVVDCLGGKLMSIGWYALLADHVVVSRDGMMLDSDGIYPEDEMLAKYSRLAHAPLAIWLITSSTVSPPAGDAQTRTMLAALLASHLPREVARDGSEPVIESGPERRRGPRPRKAANALASLATAKAP